jgi:hypothetical protein
MEEPDQSSVRKRCDPYLTLNVVLTLWDMLSKAEHCARRV